MYQPRYLLSKLHCTRFKLLEPLVCCIPIPISQLVFTLFSRSLTLQLQTLQSLVSKCTQGAVKLQQSVNVGTCLSVVVLCFALIVANYAPVGHFTSQTQNSDLYSTNTVKARALLSIEYPFNSWLPEWSSKSREQCSNLLSVFLTLRFPKPYSLFDMYADPELNTADIFIADQ